MGCFKKLFVCLSLSLIMGMTLVACSDDDAGNRHSASSKSNTIIAIGVTTTLEDAGLLSVLVSAFQQDHKITVKPIVAGSGQIHKLLERGDLDLAITHDPAGEKALLTKGIIKQRIPLMQNDFIIVGPQTDPAHIKLSLTPAEALNKIVNVNALFVSRADNSGTHQMEQGWWGKTNRRPADQYYFKTGTGMGATLNIVAERNAYTFVDRATWTNFANKQQLGVLFEDADLMPNIYSLLIKNEAPLQEKVILWRNWISEGQGLQIILDYSINGQPLFFKAPKRL
jgi:tungstate transport system substrate-binding protein